jgi:hypothetical protein
MKKSFMVTLTTNQQTGDIVSVYFRIRKGGRVSEVREFADGAAFANYNRKGELLGVELIAPCNIEVLDQIAIEPDVVKFMRRAAPHGFMEVAVAA